MPLREGPDEQEKTSILFSELLRIPELGDTLRNGPFIVAEAIGITLIYSSAQDGRILSAGERPVYCFQQGEQFAITSGGGSHLPAQVTLSVGENQYLVVTREELSKLKIEVPADLYARLKKKHEWWQQPK